MGIEITMELDTEDLKESDKLIKKMLKNLSVEDLKLLLKFKASKTLAEVSSNAFDPEDF